MTKAKNPSDCYRPVSKSVLAAIASGDIVALRRVLTVRQCRFAEEYVLDFNGAAAAVRAGYATKYADRQAHLLLRHDGVLAYIDHLTMSAAAKIMSVDPDYVIQGITKILSKEGAKDGDKLRGYELLARILGMFIDKTEISGRDGGPIEMEQRTKEEAESFTSIIKQMSERAKKDVKIV